MNSGNTFLSMPRQESQHTEKRPAIRRKYHGEFRLLPVVSILNHDPDSLPQDAISFRELLVLCIRLQEAAAQMDSPASGSLIDALKFAREHKETPEDAEVRTLELEINTRLLEFQSIPVIRVRRSTGKGTATRLASHQFLPRHVTSWWSEDPDSYHPFYALLDAIEDGTLANVKACSCGKYFFKKFAHQRFCSEECRVKENQNSEKARESRRRWQRDNYQAHKALDSGSQATT